MKDNFLLANRRHVDKAVNDLFSRFAYVAPLTLRLHIPTYDEIRNTVPDSEIDHERVENVYFDINTHPEIFGDLMANSIISYGKLLGLYGHRKEPLRTRFIYQVSEQDDAHYIDLIYLIGYHDFNQDPLYSMHLLQQDITALSTSLLTILTADTFNLPRTPEVADLILNKVKWSYDDSLDVIKTKKCFERDDRFLTAEEKVEVERRKKLPPLFQALHRCKDGMLTQHKGVYFFFVHLFPINIDDIRKHSTAKDGEVDTLQSLFFRDPKVVMELALELFNQRRENIGCDEIDYVVYPQLNKQGELEFYKVGIVLSLKEEGPLSNPILHKNPMVVKICTLIGHGFLEFFCFDNLDAAQQASIIADHIQVPMSLDHNNEYTPIEGAVIFNKPNNHEHH